MDETPSEEYPHEWVPRYGPQAPQAHFQPSHATDRKAQNELAIRIVAAIIGGGALALWGLIVLFTLSSAFSTDPARDPHGYGIVLGIFAYVPVGLAWTFVLPFVAPRRWWWRALGISVLTFVLLTVLALWALDVSGAT
ncbi:hypothetical protein [Mycolicibacterium sp. HK-90]|uniref:hypothetical protein n=1 Tax=Mycolicibacterium sp. HK-90 TaxID=3056937 RepID=UPI00265B04F4|nr:hypothetical protein [Mycolicibacterium sp. HK-90]WKG04681.1 hypothetical protein QU592_06130 [Mycolicibacterium sp. HK-90]